MDGLIDLQRSLRKRKKEKQRRQEIKIQESKEVKRETKNGREKGRKRERIIFLVCQAPVYTIITSFFGSPKQLFMYTYMKDFFCVYKFSLTHIVVVKIDMKQTNLDLVGGVYNNKFVDKISRGCFNYLSVKLTVTLILQKILFLQ